MEENNTQLSMLNGVRYVHRGETLLVSDHDWDYHQIAELVKRGWYAAFESDLHPNYVETLQLGGSFRFKQHHMICRFWGASPVAIVDRKGCPLILRSSIPSFSLRGHWNTQDPEELEKVRSVAELMQR